MHSKSRVRVCLCRAQNSV